MGRKDVESSCRDCEICTTSSAARGMRNMGKAAVAFSTGGMSLAATALVKRCRLCGHPMKKHADRPELKK